MKTYKIEVIKENNLEKESSMGMRITEEALELNLNPTVLGTRILNIIKEMEYDETKTN